jgi:hypothetical protein
MADQLRASGQDVSLLILLDPRLRTPGGVRYYAWLAWRAFRRGQLIQAAGHRVRRRLKRPDYVRDESADISDVEGSLARLCEAYEPPSLDFPATVILSEGFEEQFALPRWYLMRVVRRPQKWAPLQCVSHPRLLSPPDVYAVAREVRAALDALASRTV